MSACGLLDQFLKSTKNPSIFSSFKIPPFRKNKTNSFNDLIVALLYPMIKCYKAALFSPQNFNNAHIPSSPRSFKLKSILLC